MIFSPSTVKAEEIELSKISENKIYAGGDDNYNAYNTFSGNVEWDDPAKHNAGDTATLTLNENIEKKNYYTGPDGYYSDAVNPRKFVIILDASTDDKAYFVQEYHAIAHMLESLKNHPNDEFKIFLFTRG